MHAEMGWLIGIDGWTKDPGFFTPPAARQIKQCSVLFVYGRNAIFLIILTNYFRLILQLNICNALVTRDMFWLIEYS